MAVYMANNTRSGTRLTDAKLRNLQAGSDALTHAAVSGLLIIPSKNTKGVGSWYIRFYNPTNKSQRVKMKIGDYPAMGLSESYCQIWCMAFRPLSLLIARLPVCHL